MKNSMQGYRQVSEEVSSDQSTRQMILTKANICMDGGATLKLIL